jgi:hypothetical protein
MRCELSNKNTPRRPQCPAFAQVMRLARITSRFDDLPDLYTFECRACGVSQIEIALRGGAPMSDHDETHPLPTYASHPDMDEAFCARMRAAIELGLESAPVGVITTSGTRNPKYVAFRRFRLSRRSRTSFARHLAKLLWPAALARRSQSSEIPETSQVFSQE